MILFHYPKFERFLNIYYVEETKFHWACNQVEHLKIEITDYFFENKEKLKNFYIIINGKISAKYIHIPNSELMMFNSKETVYEDIEIILANGDYFSENLKHKNLTLSKITILEDLDLICIEKHFYLKIFERNFARFEREKKMFILNTIKPLGNLPGKSISIFTNQMITNVIRNTLLNIFSKFIYDYLIKVLNYNDVVYCEGEVANKIHLIFKGSFDLLVKNFNKLSNLDKINIGKERLKTILKLEKGYIAGIEAIDINSKYEQTLRVFFKLLKFR